MQTTNHQAAVSHLAQAISTTGMVLDWLAGPEARPDHHPLEVPASDKETFKNALDVIKRHVASAEGLILG